ncbi:hypothetical protein [Amycolatopsis cihanbeyliensis]|uniref:PE family protein n=1 Tax=Amycolatopsis cihanbeyliensis TaxID=1128664 RepID=A0A542DL45_AMYCI|nr:hypothetical protein [Amycolatopsis cihanbeyliensis]TQJ03809.1 hypothetical protein FB471_3577 [Amycolatopsis cihanbeyliensis]
MSQRQSHAPVDTLTSVPAPAPIQVGNNGASGGYKFTPEEVDGVIAKWRQLLEDLRSDEREAWRVAHVQPPGREFASGDFVDQGANPSGKTLLEQHQRMIEYVESYIEALEKASGKIQESEDEAQQAIAKQGQGIV